MIEKTHTEKTSAADKSIGFDFQFYYFLLRLMNLKVGETIGLEVMDDVHTELANSRQILIQLKHTTQESAEGSKKNLTTLDPDLWKSLSNWSQIIADDKANRGDLKKQIEFVQKTDFLLVSNKLENEKNKVINAIKSFQDKNSDYNALKATLTELRSKTTDTVISGYIEKVLSLNNDVAEIFFNNIRFDLDCDDIIKRCKTAIKEKHIDDSKIDDVFRNLDSQIRADNFFTVKEKKKITLNFDDFHKKYRRYFDLARNDSLVIKKFNGTLPDCLEKQKFIQQLVDIGDIQSDDVDSMATVTKNMLLTKNNLDEWEKSGDITHSEVEDFDEEAKARWTNEFHHIHQKICSEEETIENARKLLYAIRKEKLLIASQEMTTPVSNGQFYKLSDTPEIGWHKEWEKKYK